MQKSIDNVKRLFSSYDINIFQIKLDQWLCKTHTHNFYELILINEGKGIHYLNECSLPYKRGSIFLLTPSDMHKFRIEKPSTFTYIKFTEQIFKGKLEWVKKVQDVFNNPNTIPESIIQNEYDTTIVFDLSHILLHEFNHMTIYSRQLVLSLFETLITVVIRNLLLRNAPSHLEAETNRTQQKVDEVLSYIRQNIGEKQKISLNAIAEKFYLSPKYASLYIKKHTGNGLKHIITSTRLQTAETLLKQSHLTISQIAEKSGFTDASHMNKMFQKYKNINPSELR